MPDPRDRRPASRPGPPQPQAFVVQVDVGSSEEPLRGRVEHLASGVESRFTSADDLIAFFQNLGSPGSKGS